MADPRKIPPAHRGRSEYGDNGGFRRIILTYDAIHLGDA